MPTYQYRCTQCGADLEVVQKFTDPSLTTCPECEGELRKVFSAVGVVFKGSGFYATDSRSSTSSTSASDSAPAKSGAPESGTSGTKASESKESTAPASTPAASKPASEAKSA